MATPAITDFILYTATPLTDSDYEYNWTKLVAYVTDGTFDFTTNSLTTTDDVTVGADLAVTGDTNLTGNLVVGGTLSIGGSVGNVVRKTTTTTSTDATSVTIALGTSGVYRVYGCIKNGVVGVSGATYSIQFGLSSSIDGASNYSWRYLKATSSAGYDADNDDTSIQIGIASSSAYENLPFDMNILGSGNTTIPKTVFFRSFDIQTDDKTQAQVNTGEGCWANVAAGNLTHIKFIGSAANSIGTGSVFVVEELV